MAKPRITTINISTQTFVKVLIILAALWFLYTVRDILAILFVAIIVASALGPWVDSMHKRKVPRGVGILLIYLGILAVLVITLVLLIPILADQVGQMAVTFPVYSDRLIEMVQNLQAGSGSVDLGEQLNKVFDSVQSGLLAFAGGLFFRIFDVLGGLVAFFVIFVLSFYMTVEDDLMKRSLKFVTPLKYQAYINRLVGRIQKKIGLWLRAQLILSVVIFVFSWVGLSLLGVEYALTLALVAGLTEFVPVIGPILGAVPAVFIAFNQSPWTALFVIILYLVIQRVENDWLVPKIMQKTVGINPLISIIALLVGAKLGGIVGALLAIPVATALGVVISDFFGEEEKEKAVT